MSKFPETAAPLTELLANRWSPRSFDLEHQLSSEEVLSILEAGRWAPSASNGQPWRFSVALRGDELHQKVVESLTGFNQAWAPDASMLLVVSIAKAEDGTSSKRNFYDAGLSVALMSVQAQAMGLFSHQMSGIIADQMQSSLGIDEKYEVAVVVAFGKKDNPEKFEGAAYEREIAPRQRLALEEIVLHGKP